MKCAPEKMFQLHFVLTMLTLPSAFASNYDTMVRRYHSCNPSAADVEDQESNDAKLSGLRIILRIACSKQAPGTASPRVNRHDEEP